MTLDNQSQSLLTFAEKIHDIDVAQIVLETMRSLPSTFLSSRTLKVGWEFCGDVQTEGAKNNKRKLK